jgi:pyruvate formate lyase activating enzyme
VRHNDNGRLVTLNYGKSVALTREVIETEAVYHYAPGEPILSLGNIGCMMACDFCHNWRTSQARLAQDADIEVHTPEGVVDYALRHGIRMLSWTYNDPVVWQEFVVDTARLARQHGIKNLYKSAFYIGPSAVDELLEVIDIFSLSLKSMDADFYRKHTKGRLEPTLAAIERVYRAGTAHLELSNLCVTGRNDTLEDARRIARWVRDTLDDQVPLHFVRFHPDYKYTHVPRTDVGFLEAAQAAARDEGLAHVYLGNVDLPMHTACSACGTPLVTREHGVARRHFHGHTCQCGAPVPFVLPWPDAPRRSVQVASGDVSHLHRFRGPLRVLHVAQPKEMPVEVIWLDDADQPLGAPEVHSCTRFQLAHPRAAAVRLRHVHDSPVQVFEIYDRAHFPTVDTAQPSPSADRPLPFFEVRR